VTPPLVKLDSQGSNRGPDVDIAFWLVWLLVAILAILFALRWYEGGHG